MKENIQKYLELKEGLKFAQDAKFKKLAEFLELQISAMELSGEIKQSDVNGMKLEKKL